MNELEADPRGGKLFFTAEENSKVSMYASHPPNNLRENNAKSPFIEGEIDNRSPWILFPNASELQEALTLNAYREYFGKYPKEFSDISEFKEFIAGETVNETLLEEYHFSFKDRFVMIPENNALSEAAVGDVKDDAFFDDLKARAGTLMEPIKELNNKMELIQSIAQGTSKEKSFTHGGKKYGKKQLQEGWHAVLQEREKYFEESFKEWDKDFFCAYYTIGVKQGKGDELINAYNQHHNIVLVYKKLLDMQNKIMEEIHKLQTRSEVTEREVSNVSDKIKERFREMNELIEALSHKVFVKMPNINSVEELQAAIIENGQFPIESGFLFENGRFETMMHHLERGVSHLMRIEQKSIAGILELHASLKS